MDKFYRVCDVLCALAWLWLGVAWSWGWEEPGRVFPAIAAFFTMMYFFSLAARG